MAPKVLSKQPAIKDVSADGGGSNTATSVNKKAYTAKMLRGFLQHKGEAISTEVLCQPVIFHEK